MLAALDMISSVKLSGFIENYSNSTIALAGPRKLVQITLTTALWLHYKKSGSHVFLIIQHVRRVCAEQLCINCIKLQVVKRYITTIEYPVNLIVLKGGIG